VKRAKYFVCTAESLARMLEHNSLVNVVEGIPAGSRVLGAQFDIMQNAFLVSVEHPSFPVVPEGDCLPQIFPVFRTARWA
jgi:hypothetical protein